MATICLNMIVKDESREIVTTLENIVSKIKIDYWVISDTGSSDNTIYLIEDFFSRKGIPGELYRDEWENFGANRQKALKYAEGKSDYVLFFDADDRIEGELNVDSLTSRGYSLLLTDESKTSYYNRPLIVKNDGTYYWRGVLHEFIVDSQNQKFEKLEGDYFIISRRTGNRSQDPDKYKKDALLLEKAIYENIDTDLHLRYMFYAGQSWMSYGDEEKAVYWYKKRAEHIGWDQELYQTYYRLGSYYDSIKDEATAINYYMKSASAYPNATEPWYQLSRMNSWAGRRDIAYIFSLRAVESLENNKENYLFESADIKQYWAYYELFINGYLTNNFEKSYYALKKLILNNAPCWLFKNEKDKLIKLKEYINKDSFENIKEIKAILVDKKEVEIIDTLEL